MVRGEDRLTRTVTLKQFQSAKLEQAPRKAPSSLVNPALAVSSLPKRKCTELQKAIG
jgi:hypothetical protein